ncbi:MAG: response regulator transcription factor [Chloroflexota bacterium]|jgi:DNA-binding response OmpR family regulator
MKVLIIEDDLALADVLAFTLRRAGFETMLAHDGLEGLERWQAESPDLIVLDLNLPKMDGMAVCRRISADGETPIVILSVRSDDDDVVMGLKLGADDYVVKPFSPRQLVARIEAVLRRANHQTITPGPIKAGDFTLDPLSHKLWHNGELVASLTPLETRLLEALIPNNGQVVPTDSLIDYIWGPAGGDRVMLKQLVYRLRRKIDDGSSALSYLETITGVGYSFVPDVPILEREDSLCLAA